MSLYDTITGLASKRILLRIQLGKNNAKDGLLKKEMAILKRLIVLEWADATDEELRDFSRRASVAHPKEKRTWSLAALRHVRAQHRRTVRKWLK